MAATVKLLLHESIRSLGRVGDVVEVSSGYARNYLLPQGLAVEPTAGNLKKIETRKKEVEAIEAAKRADQAAVIAKLAGVSESTVSRALAGSPLVAKKKREEIVAIARDRGYVINSAARNLRLRRSEAISVVFPLGHEAGQPLTDPFFVEMLGHLADEITQRGYGVLLQKILPPMDAWLPRLEAANPSMRIVDTRRGIALQPMVDDALRGAGQAGHPEAVGDQVGDFEVGVPSFAEYSW